MTTRGVRNNNPGNIRHGDPWRGLALLQSDPDFCQFIEPIYGLRAMYRVLMTYGKEGVNTLSGIAKRWAPASENDCKAYTTVLCDHCGFGEDEVIEVTSIQVARAIIMVENGLQPYTWEQLIDAQTLAGMKL